MTKIHIALDANEANVSNRVGSNVYAYHILEELAKIVDETNECEATVLISKPPLDDLPKPTRSWQYRVITPAKLWTQLAAPWHLYTHQFDYDVFFTPGHYAPRFCSVPYVSCVLDLAYLRFPKQFKKSDLFQLKNWTKYSVENAKKVIAISQFTKNEVIEEYHLPARDVIVAHPSVNFPEYPATKAEVVKYLMQYGIRQPFFLSIGTLQPRKNLINLVKAYELFCQEHFQKDQKQCDIPQLVICGKQGWLAEPILEAIEKSPNKKNIILTGYLPNEYKPQIYQLASTTILVGLYEGFGIPPLESIHFGTLPIVSDNTSLPEVVGDAGLLINPHQPQSIAEALTQICKMSVPVKKRYQEKMQTQRAKFSWQQSAETIFHVLLDAIEESKKQ